MIKRPTLGQVFVSSLMVLAAVLALLFYLVSDASRRTLLESSERIRDNASREIGDRVEKFLAEAPDAVGQFQGQLARGLIDARSPQAIEPALFELLLSNRDFGEVTLTYGELRGFDENGVAVLAEKSRGQWSVVRTPAADSGDQFWSRHVHEEGDSFVAERRELGTDKTPVALPSHRDRAPAFRIRPRIRRLPRRRDKTSVVSFCGAICTGRNWTLRCRRHNAVSKSACSRL